MVYGTKSDFDRVLDNLSDTIQDFDIKSFTSSDIVPQKAHVLSSALLIKVFNIWM